MMALPAQESRYRHPPTPPHKATIRDLLEGRRGRISFAGDIVRREGFAMLPISWMRKHIAGLLGATALLLPLWNGLKWILDWIGRVETLGKAGSMIDVLTAPPMILV